MCRSSDHEHNDSEALPVRKDTDFGKAYFIRNVIRVLIALPGFGLLFYSAFNHGRFLWLGIAIFVLDILWWAIDDNRRFSVYACPECGMHLGKQAQVIVGEDKAVCYDCPACRVRWDTDLRYSSTSG